MTQDIDKLRTWVEQWPHWKFTEHQQETLRALFAERDTLAKRLEEAEGIARSHALSLTDELARRRKAEDELEAVKVHSRKQAEDIMKLGPMVYDDSAQPVEWKARAEAAESELARLKDRVAGLEKALRAAKKFHDRDSGCNGFTADYELLRLEIDQALTTDNPGGDTARDAILADGGSDA